jgi:GUCT (NUC152) domain
MPLLTLLFSKSLHTTILHRAGQTSVKRRSLLNGQEGYVTCLFAAAWAMERPGYVFGYLRRRLDESMVNQVARMRLTADSKGAVFDVPEGIADDLLAKCASSFACTHPALHWTCCTRSC